MASAAGGPASDSGRSPTRSRPACSLAQAIGRLGNWFNQELFGLPTDLPWGLEIDSDEPRVPAGLAEGTLFHPTFLYEVIWNGLGVPACCCGRAASSACGGAACSRST